MNVKLVFKAIPEQKKGFPEVTRQGVGMGNFKELSHAQESSAWRAVVIEILNLSKI